MKFETIIKKTKKDHPRNYATVIQVDSGMATWSDGFRLIQHKTNLQDGVWTFKNADPTLSSVRYPQHAFLWKKKDKSHSIPVPNGLFTHIKPSAKSSLSCRAVYDLEGQFWSVRPKEGLIKDRHVAFDPRSLSEICETPWDFAQIEDSTLHLFSDSGSRAIVVNCKID